MEGRVPFLDKEFLDVAMRVNPSDKMCVPSEASVACSTAIALEWDAAFRGMNDPSGQAVKGVHEKAY